MERGVNLHPCGRLVELRQKLENAGFVNITYMVVNSRDENSLRLHHLLEKRLSGHIILHRQNSEDPDVWSIAQVEKDDFQIYDRCGRLTHHLSLPYTILSQTHVEEAIRNTYCNAVCGDCELKSSDQLEACNRNGEDQTEKETPRTEGEEHHHHHGHHRGLHHGENQHGHPPHEVEGRHSHDGSSHQHGHQGQVILGQDQRGSVDLGQVQSRQIDFGQAHVGQIDLGQLGIERFDLEHGVDVVGNQQVMQRP
ncbi:hypothetical protein HF521_006520 [Silurus meridionalis]|uniref:Selenoprotein P N-terminal domain-containing protein n=1 Tax=Silurus meridionalis TaxID=175797 RepID=A0A8T0ANR2_SILME|nr:hypothetical protein HF521_006520 [Silurus meridionalis]